MSSAPKAMVRSGLVTWRRVSTMLSELRGGRLLGPRPQPQRPVADG